MKRTLQSFLVCFAVLLSSTSSFALTNVDLHVFDARQAAFPKGPDASLTPGKLCDHPDRQRYPEQIDYCERSVDHDEKQLVIRMYDRQLGYSIGSMNRNQFKIDHYIPLCAGGSNDMSNLWPQHQSIYEITDPLEPAVCEKMAQGSLLQKEAVDLIRRAKNNLNEVDEILSYVRSL